MSQAEIGEKLMNFLTKETPFRHESDVIYFLVESRKMLDHGRRAGAVRFLPILRFYSDWALHIEKTRMIPEIEEIMAAIHKDPSVEQLNKFLEMERLKKDLVCFCETFGLRPFPAESSVWASFQRLLVCVIADQPIIMSGEHLKIFRIVLSDGGVLLLNS